VKVKYGFVLHTGLSFALHITQIENQNKGVRNKILGILHDFRIFFIGKRSFYRTPGKARKIPDLLL
jgi:hypothetical protein